MPRQRVGQRHDGVQKGLVLFDTKSMKDVERRAKRTRAQPDLSTAMSKQGRLMDALHVLQSSKQPVPGWQTKEKNCKA